MTSSFRRGEHGSRVLGILLFFLIFSIYIFYLNEYNLGIFEYNWGKMGSSGNERLIPTSSISHSYSQIVVGPTILIPIPASFLRSKRVNHSDFGFRFLNSQNKHTINTKYCPHHPSLFIVLLASIATSFDNIDFHLRQVFAFNLILLGKLTNITMTSAKLHLT